VTTASRINPYRAAPAAIKPMLDFEKAVQGLGIGPKLLHLVKLRASLINGCAYCIDLHNREARADGEQQQRLDLLPVWWETDFFDAREQAALRWTEALTLISETHAPDEAYAALTAAFNEAECVALTVAIGAINSWNRISIGFRSKPARARSAPEKTAQATPAT
jgi:AhpD family alkylhydroperoxidase